MNASSYNKDFTPNLTAKKRPTQSKIAPNSLTKTKSSLLRKNWFWIAKFLYKDLIDYFDLK